MHLRVEPSRGKPGLNALRVRRRLAFRLLALIACAAIGACHRPARARDLTFDWSLAPRPPAVGPAVLTLRIHDAAHRPVAGARVRVEAQMSHPGMAPAIATATERQPGVYEAPVQFTMDGDWIVLVTGSLATGETLDYRIDVPGVRSP